MPEELQPPSPPEENGKKPIVTEIINAAEGPPPPSSWMKNAATVVVVLLATVGLGFAVYGNWPDFSWRMKTAVAPIEDPSQSSFPTPTRPAEIPAPPIAVGPAESPDLPIIPFPEPEVAGQTDTEPDSKPQKNESPTPSPAAEAPRAAKPAQTLHPAVYTDVSGFIVNLKAGEQVYRISSAWVAVYDKNKRLVGKIEVIDTLLDYPGLLEQQLRASPSITDLRMETVGGQSAWRYTIDESAQGAAFVKGNRVYYVWDYSGTGLLSRFAVR